MATAALILAGVLFAVVLLLSFLLLGSLRALAILRWRIDQLEATTPSRIGRNGLRPGQRAPEFALVSTTGATVSLRDYHGRKVLVVFTQSGCEPCHAIVPDLKRLADERIQVLVINNGEMDATRTWATEARVNFPVLVQEHFRVSRQYEAFATPFAFLIDEQGVVVSRGIVSKAEYLRFVTAGVRGNWANAQAENARTQTDSSTADAPHSPSALTEKNHA